MSVKLSKRLSISSSEKTGQFLHPLQQNSAIHLDENLSNIDEQSVDFHGLMFAVSIDACPSTE